MPTFRYVILGGGLTAGYAAQEFVEQGVAPGELCILSAEETIPYERPPLSKGFLAGKKTTDDILINEGDFYEEHGIELMLGSRVFSVNLNEKRLYTDDDTINFDKLLIATGSTPRKFDVSGAELDNIFYLRQIIDAQRIRDAALSSEKAVVVGGSFIGMETASVLQSQGVETTMIFPGERVWASFFTPEMSAFFENYYRERGVTFMPGEKVSSFEGNGTVAGVVTSSGERVSADLAVCGIGVIPNSQLFKGSQLKMKDDGIQVNEYLETSLPDVYAAGDITWYWDVIYNRLLHIEHWDNAVAQGRHAARNMMGRRRPFEHVPYFFSDVFDLSYEFWGSAEGSAKEIVRGDITSDSFSVWWLTEDGRLLAAFVMNRPDNEREMAPEWIKSHQRLPESWLAEELAP